MILPMPFLFCFLYAGRTLNPFPKSFCYCFFPVSKKGVQLLFYKQGLSNITQYPEWQSVMHPIRHLYPAFNLGKMVLVIPK